MRSFIDLDGNLHFREEEDFYVEMLVEENNKNEPAAVVQRCRDNDNNYNKEIFQDIMAKMSDTEFVKFCNDIRKLQQFADTYQGLWATPSTHVPEDYVNDYLEIKHPLAKEDETRYDEYNPPPKEVLKTLKERVQKFVDIQPGYSSQEVRAWWENDTMIVVYGPDPYFGISGLGESIDEAFRDFISFWNIRKRGLR